jgi:hypothetical protein
MLLCRCARRFQSLAAARTFSVAADLAFAAASKHDGGDDELRLRYGRPPGLPVHRGGVAQRVDADTLDARRPWERPRSPAESCEDRPDRPAKTAMAKRSSFIDAATVSVCPATVFVRSSSSSSACRRLAAVLANRPAHRSDQPQLGVDGLAVTHTIQAMAIQQSVPRRDGECPCSAADLWNQSRDVWANNGGLARIGSRGELRQLPNSHVASMKDATRGS